MPPIPERLRLLRSRVKRESEVIRVLLAALPYATNDELPPLAEALASSRRPEALSGLVRLLHRLDEQTARRCTLTAPDPAAALRSFRTDPRVQHRLSIVRFVRLRGDGSLAGVLADQLDVNVTELRQAAAEALLALVECAMGPSGRTDPPPRVLDALDEAVSRSLKNFRAHREPAILVAAALMTSRPGPQLAALLEEADSPAAFTLRGACECVDRPSIRRNLLRWLLTPPLDRSALRRLADVRGNQGTDDVLAGAHLIANPGRRRALRTLDRAPRSLTNPATAAELSESGQCGLVDLISALGIATDRRVALLADLIVLPSPLARQRVVRALCGPASTGHHGARRALEQFCFDRNESVATVAALARQECDHPLPDVVTARLQRSPHPRAAQLATAAQMHDSVEGYFASWMDAPAHECRAAAHRWMARDERRFLAGLATILRRDEDADAADREADTALVAAIMLVRQLGVADRMARELARLATSAWPRAASAAIAALGEARLGDDVIEPLTQALHHDHPRVRANAIDALRRVAPAALDEHLSALAGDSANRPRASAVAALLARRPALGLVMLRQMLGDWNPLHRISALWAARSFPDESVREELRRVAECDPHPEVRIRAVRAWQSSRQFPPRPPREATLPARYVPSSAVEDAA